MGLFDFLKKKETVESQEFDLGNGMFGNEKGEIYGELQIKTSFNGQEFIHKLPINTTVEKLKEEDERKEANKANPDSCEREPTENEVLIHISNIDKYHKSMPIEHPLRDKLFEAEIRTITSGCNNIVISRKELDELELQLKRHNDSIIQQSKVYELLNKGCEFEKTGDIDKAISIYQEVVSIGYDGVGYGINKPYDRLMILYRKKKDVENEIKIIEKVIMALLEKNNKCACRAIEQHPDKKKEILSALPNCSRVMGNDGFYCFIPYDIVKYRDRLLKIKDNGKNRN